MKKKVIDADAFRIIEFFDECDSLSVIQRLEKYYDYVKVYEDGDITVCNFSD